MNQKETVGDVCFCVTLELKTKSKVCSLNSSRKTALDFDFSHYRPLTLLGLFLQSIKVQLEPRTKDWRTDLNLGTLIFNILVGIIQKALLTWL